MLVFYFSLSHGSWSSLKWAEWRLSLTSLLPKLHSASKGYRSKGPSVLPVGLGNKRQRPFKRERERERESPADVRLQCVSQAPGSLSQLSAEACVRGSFVGSGKEIPCWLWVVLSCLPQPLGLTENSDSLFSWTFWSFVMDFTPVWSCLYNSWPH